MRGVRRGGPHPGDADVPELVCRVLGAGLAAGGNLIAAYYNSVEQRRLESVKAESQLILEVIKTANPDKAAENLNFLVQTQLIADRSRHTTAAPMMPTTTFRKGPCSASVRMSMLASQPRMPPTTIQIRKFMLHSVEVV